MQRASDAFWTASNMLSVFRGLLAIPIAIFINSGDVWIAFGLCWFASFTDWADGYVARKTNTVSEWGKILDPIADKIIVGIIMVMLVLNNSLPLWFVIAVVSRDIIIVLGGIILRRYTPVIVPSKMSGKLAVTAIALTGVSALVGWNEVRDVGIYVSCVVMAVSLIDYGMRFNGIIRQNQETL